jgi:hypothetical protein
MHAVQAICLLPFLSFKKFLKIATIIWHNFNSHCNRRGHGDELNDLLVSLQGKCRPEIAAC